MFNIVTKIYQMLIFCGNTLKSPLLLVCRLHWGWLFMYAGWGKLTNIDDFVSLLNNFAFPLVRLQAYLAGYIELIGGICLILGLASRLVSLPLILVMVVAYATVHLNALKIDLSAFFSEAPFNFLLTALLVLAFGPGRFSLDHFIEKWLFSRAKEFPKHEHLS